MAGEKVSAAMFAQYMKGIDFPARKKDIVETAKSNKAPQSVMQYMNRLPDKQYDYPTDVQKEFSKLK